MYRVPEHREVDYVRREKNASSYGGSGMTSHLEDHVIPKSRQREKARDNLKWIGQDMKRVEDPRLLTGKGKYIDDLELPNIAYAVFCLKTTTEYAEARPVL